MIEILIFIASVLIFFVSSISALVSSKALDIYLKPSVSVECASCIVRLGMWIFLSVCVTYCGLCFARLRKYLSRRGFIACIGLTAVYGCITMTCITRVNISVVDATESWRIEVHTTDLDALQKLLYDMNYHCSAKHIDSNLYELLVFPNHEDLIEKVMTFLLDNGYQTRRVGER